MKRFLLRWQTLLFPLFTFLLVYAIVLMLHQTGLISQKADEQSGHSMKAAGTFVPIIMYHHLANENPRNNKAIISPQKFEGDMLALKAAGYETISFRDYEAVRAGFATLPKKPIILTFDDGYMSNYKHAFPVLQKLNMKATINVVVNEMGTYSGAREEQKTSSIPRFDWDHAREMVDSGLIDIQCHSYDMHGKTPGKKPSYQINAKKGETVYSYIKRFRDDSLKCKTEIEKQLGQPVFVYTYPFGRFNWMRDLVLRSAGFKYTLSVRKGISNLESQYLLRRINSDETLTPKKLIDLIETYKINAE